MKLSVEYRRNLTFIFLLLVTLKLFLALIASEIYLWEILTIIYANQNHPSATPPQLPYDICTYYLTLGWNDIFTLGIVKCCNQMHIMNIIL
jgi:hypothetical protein